MCFYLRIFIVKYESIEIVDVGERFNINWGKKRHSMEVSK